MRHVLWEEQWVRHDPLVHHVDVFVVERRQARLEHLVSIEVSRICGELTIIS